MSYPRPRWRDPGVANPDQLSRRGRRWTDDEIQFLSDYLLVMRPETLARKLGRTLRGVRQACNNRRLAPTTQELVTSGAAAEMTGYTRQYLTQLARARRLRAQRVPGSRWWLFDPADLDLLTEGYDHGEGQR